MRKLSSALAGVALLASTSAHADNEGMEKYKNWLPSQIIAMSDKERESEVPMTYIWAANTARSPLGELAVQSNLNTLMYNGVGDYDGAKRRYQADLGEPATGNLTVSQISKLGYRAERTRLTSVSFFPFQFGGRIYPNIAILHGTVKLVDDVMAYPVNFVEIQCTKSDMTCSYRQTVLALPNESSFRQSYAVMESINDTYTVTRWDENRIDARPATEGKCRVNELRLNFATKEFYEFATNAPEGDCSMLMGGSLPKLEKPRVAQIVDGDPIISEVFNKLNKEAYPYLSSEFRAKLEAATPPAAK